MAASTPSVAGAPQPVVPGVAGRAARRQRRAAARMPANSAAGPSQPAAQPGPAGAQPEEVTLNAKHQKMFDKFCAYTDVKKRRKFVGSLNRRIARTRRRSWNLVRDLHHKVAHDLVRCVHPLDLSESRGGEVSYVNSLMPLHNTQRHKTTRSLEILHSARTCSG